MSAAAGGLRQVLVIGWFPSADDTSAGRFIADQVTALAATGTVRPSVVAFENAVVRGPGSLRDREAAAIAANTTTGVRAADPFSPGGAAGPIGVPVARLAIAAGETPATGPDHRALHREAGLLALAARANKDRWDLVHAHVGYPTGAAAAVLAARLGRPLVITEHASFLDALLAEPVVRARYRDTAIAAARMVAVSRTLAGELERIVPELAGRILVIPNTVAVEDFGGGTAAERVPSELLWVGARLESKGIATLLRAFALVRDGAPHATLRLIGRAGRPDQEEGWHGLAGQLGIADGVRFEPAADRAGVAAAMRRAELFVHPSPRETFGVVAVEALASGLPVVAADSGGVTEVLGDEPGPFGAIVAAGDPAALAAAILDALGRRDSFDPSRLRAHALEHYGAARVAGRIADLYGEVLDEHGGVGSSAPAWPTPVAGSGDEGGDGEGGGGEGEVVIVGFSRLELERALAAFPAGVVADAVLVTCGAPVTGHPRVRLAPAGTESAVADLLDWGAPPAGRSGRLRRRLRRARRMLPRWVPGGRGRSDRALLDDLARTLSDALPAGPTASPPVLVCLGGLDHLVAAPLIVAGRATPAPGGLRWLADRRAGGPQPPAPGLAPASVPAPASSDA